MGDFADADEGHSASREGGHTQKCLQTPGLGCSTLLVQISTLIATPNHLTLTVLDMSTRVSPPVCCQPGTVDSNKERRARRRAIDFSRTNITYTGNISSSGCSTPRGPDIEKELPGIPLTSTGVCDTETATVPSDVMVSSVTSAPSLPPLSVSLQAHQSEVSCLQTLEVRFFLVSVPIFVFPTHFLNSFSISCKLITQVFRQVHVRPPLALVYLQDPGPNPHPVAKFPMNVRTQSWMIPAAKNIRGWILIQRLHHFCCYSHNPAIFP